MATAIDYFSDTYSDVGGGLIYLFTGPVDRRVYCDQSKLAADHLCLDTVRTVYQGKVLWVDARDAKSYARQHVPGAILVPENDAENYLSKPEVMQAIGMSGVGGQALVICSETRSV